MENASKALLMAAGVLMGVLVLSLIIYIYATFSDTTQKSVEQMKLNELSAFNNKYLAYDRRDDLTYYDIVSIVNMAMNDNKEDKKMNEDKEATNQISVIIMNSYWDNSNTNTLQGIYKLVLANLNDPNALTKYNDFVSKGNNVESFDSNLDPDPTKKEAFITRVVPSYDTLTGEAKTVKVLIKYKCIVSIDEETGRVNAVLFYKMPVNT